MMFAVVKQILWTVDQTEENNRIKKKLIRTGYPANYLNDFLNRRNRDSISSTSSSKSVTPAVSAVDLLVLASFEAEEHNNNNNNILYSSEKENQVQRPVFQQRAISMIDDGNVR
jgi:hypothetical protein